MCILLQLQRLVA